MEQLRYYLHLEVPMHCVKYLPLAPNTLHIISFFYIGAVQDGYLSPSIICSSQLSLEHSAHTLHYENFPKPIADDQSCPREDPVIKYHSPRADEEGKVLDRRLITAYDGEPMYVCMGHVFYRPQNESKSTLGLRGPHCMTLPVGERVRERQGELYLDHRQMGLPPIPLSIHYFILFIFFFTGRPLFSNV
ncbi:hypothetical protein F5X99DRAFT_387293 [Biscogniauxia marginata]|nr:hypothetical protein F5X99DRAFT_387293 [Biscogniauxia marginata]